MTLNRTQIRTLLGWLLLIAALATVFARSVQPHWHQHLRAPLAQVYLADPTMPHESRDGDFDMEVQGSEHKTVAAVALPDITPVLLWLLPLLLLFAAPRQLWHAALCLLPVPEPPRLRPPLRAPPR